MGYNTPDEVIASQTALKIAGEVTAAMVAAGLQTGTKEEILETVSFFGDSILTKIVTVIESQPAPAAPTATAGLATKSNGGTSREVFTADTPLHFGAHKGKSINDLLKSGAKGKSYVTWLGEKSTMQDVKAAAQGALGNVSYLG